MTSFICLKVIHEGISRNEGTEDYRENSSVMI